MPDVELGRLIDVETPKLNPRTAKGLAVEHLRDPENYIDKVFRSADKGFPHPFRYAGHSPTTPIEDFDEQKRRAGTNRGSRAQYDTAPSYVFMEKFHFTFDGEPLPARYISLPYVDEAGTIYISGSRYVISPIMADRVISVGEDDVFVRLLRAKLTFKRLGHHFRVNGQTETVNVVWSEIHNGRSKTKGATGAGKAKTTMMHYLLGKYGFTETFARFGKCHPVVGGPEINTNTYPASEWTICSSSQVRPRNAFRGNYAPSTIHIAVRNEEFSPVVKSMLAGFFYIADFFPQRVIPETRYLDSQRFWMILMGQILFSALTMEGQLADNIADHYHSLDYYIDIIVDQQLRDIGIQIDDVYQLFFIIIENFDSWVIDSADKLTSVYNKELNVRHFLLQDITSSIMNMNFRLNAAAKKGLTKAEAINIMKNTLKSGKIFMIAKNHGEVSTISAPGDNMAFKMTSILIPQSESNKKAKRNDRGILTDPTKLAHVSIMEICCYSNLPKSGPDGRQRVNHVAPLDDNNVVQPHAHLADETAAIQARLRR